MILNHTGYKDLLALCQQMPVREREGGKEGSRGSDWQKSGGRERECV